MKRVLTAVLAAAVAGALFIAGPLGAAPKGTSHNKSTDHPVTCADPEHTLVLRGPDTMWPPNHKYVTDINVLAKDADGESITLTTTGWHNQYEGDTELNGSGNTADDITLNDPDPITPNSGSSEEGYPTLIAAETKNGEVQTFWKARAERSGRDAEGRVYTLTAKAQFSDGTCEGTLTMFVPHDMGQGAGRPPADES